MFKILIVSLFVTSEIFSWIKISNKYFSYFEKPKFLFSVENIESKFRAFIPFILISMRGLLLLALAFFSPPKMPYVVVLYLIFISPYLIVLSIYFSEFKEKLIRFQIMSFLKTIFLFIFTLLLVFFFLIAGDTSWDGANRHAAISLLIRDNNGLWGWDLEYFALWGFTINHVVMSMYLTIFGDTRFLIINNIVIFSLFINFVFTYFKNILAKALSLSVLLSFPFVIHQLSSTYIDLSLGIFAAISAFGIRYLAIRNAPKIAFLPFVFVMGYALATATQSFLIVVSLIIFNCISYFSFPNYNVKGFFRFLVTQASLLIFSVLFFVSPFLIRNFLERGLILYPFGTPFTLQTGPLDWGDSQQKVLANIRSEIPTNITGNIEIFFYQYIYSPFEVTIEIVRSILLHGSLPDFASNSIFYRSFIYDNRLNGFGITVVLLSVVLLLILKESTSKLVNVTLLIALVGVFLLTPQSAHPRYMIGIPLFGLLVVSERFEHINYKRSYKSLTLRIYLILIIFLGFFYTLFSLKMYFDRLFPNSINIRPSSTHSAPYESTLNPECGNLYFVGHIQWYQILWGANGCGKLIDSVDYARIGPIDGSTLNPTFRIKQSDLGLLIKSFILDSSPSKTFVCTINRNFDNTLSNIEDHTRTVCSSASQSIFSHTPINSHYLVSPNQIEVYGLTFEYITIIDKSFKIDK